MKRTTTPSTSDATHLLAALDRLAAGRRRQRLRGTGAISDRMQADRRSVQRRGLTELHAAGYRIRSLRNLSAGHLEVVVAAWRARGLGAGTLRTYVSYLKVLCRWLNKPRLSAHLDTLVEPERNLARRSHQARRVLRPTVSLPKILIAAHGVDPRFACILALIATFEFTPRGAWLVRPWTLAGRADTQWLIDWARTFARAPNGSMIPPNESLAVWQRTFYRYCRSIGLTRQDGGVTAGQLYRLKGRGAQRSIRELPLHAPFAFVC